MTKTALIIIDIQCDYFANGCFPLPHMEAAARVAADALRWFREKSYPIIHLRHLEKDPGATFFVPETKGIQIHPCVNPLAAEIVVEKNFPNGFRDTTLLKTLKELKVNRVVICGAMSNMCVDATVRAAFDYGFECVVLHDACAASEIEFNGQIIGAGDVQGAFMGALASAYSTVLSFKNFINSEAVEDANA